VSFAIFCEFICAFICGLSRRLIRHRFRLRHGDPSLHYALFCSVICVNLRLSAVEGFFFVACRAVGLASPEAPDAEHSAPGRNFTHLL